MKIVGKKPLLVVAALAAALVCPIPYSRTTGYDLEVRGPAGKSATVHLPAIGTARAEQRAAMLRATGAEVSVVPRTERVWGTLYAYASEKILNVSVDTTGKTDAQIEAEIRQQLAQSGWAGDVQVQTQNGETTVRIGANDGDGRHVEMLAHKPSGAQVQLTAGDIDTKREPGMTDEQLRQKILKQLADRGLDADVTVDGDRVQIRAMKKP